MCFPHSSLPFPFDINQTPKKPNTHPQQYGLRQGKECPVEKAGENSGLINWLVCADMGQMYVYTFLTREGRQDIESCGNHGRGSLITKALLLFACQKPTLVDLLDPGPVQMFLGKEMRRQTELFQ